MQQEVARRKFAGQEHGPWPFDHDELVRFVAQNAHARKLS
jgi:hypothetical protein